jgi:hypothetical protein
METLLIQKEEEDFRPEDDPIVRSCTKKQWKKEWKRRLIWVIGLYLLGLGITFILVNFTSFLDGPNNDLQLYVLLPIIFGASALFVVIITALSYEGIVYLITRKCRL